MHVARHGILNSFRFACVHFVTKFAHRTAIKSAIEMHCIIFFSPLKRFSIDVSIILQRQFWIARFILTVTSVKHTHTQRRQKSILLLLMLVLSLLLYQFRSKVFFLSV